MTPRALARRRWLPFLAAATLGCHGGALRERLSERCAEGTRCAAAPACGDAEDERSDCESQADPFEGSPRDAASDTYESNMPSGSTSFDDGAGRPNIDARTGAADAGDTARDGGTGDANVRPEGGAPGGDGGGDALVSATCASELDQPSRNAGPGPSASIAFPPPRSYSDATTMTVRGTASDPDGVASVRVNDLAATSSDGFATWSATVPISFGCNVLRVTATDRQGNESANAASAMVRNRGASLQGVAALDLDTARNRLLVAGLGEAIATVDLDTGRVGSIAAVTLRAGPKLALIIDAARDRALVTPRGSDLLYGVDLASGATGELSLPSVDPTLQITFAEGLALDAAGTTAFATNDHPTRIVAINLQTGARRMVASDVVGSGPSLEGGVDLLYDAITSPSAPRLLMSRPAAGQILAIDPATGARSVLAGSGAALVHPARMKLDPPRRRLLVVDGEVSSTEWSNDPGARNALVAIALDSGARTTVASTDSAQGLPLASAFGLAFDPGSQVAYVAGKLEGQITRIDLASGARRLCADSNVGSGPRLIRPTGLSLAGDTLWLVDHPRHALVRVDRRSGERSDLMGTQPGGGFALQEPAGMVLEGPADNPQRALVLGLDVPALWSIELATGTRTLLSMPSQSGFSTHELPGLAFDPVGRRVLFADNTSPFNGRTLNAIDLTTGARSVISGPSRGSGPALTGTGVVFDYVASPARALVLSGSAVFSVDPSTGARSLISSGEAVGAGMMQGVLDPRGGRLLSADYWHGVVEVDLTNGRRKLLVSVLNGSGPPLVPTSIAVDFAQQVGYATSEFGHSVMALDLLADQRVILSR